MIARSLISQLVPPLKKSDSGRKALVWMADFQVRHLPVVDQGEFLGLISEEEILNFNNPDLPVGDHPISRADFALLEITHLFDVVKFLVLNSLTIVPIIDSEKNYLGLITQSSLLAHFGKALSLDDPGSILIIEVNKQDYSLAEIARICESEGSKILSSFIEARADSNLIDVTLKLNSREIEKLVATLERFEYTVKGWRVRLYGLLERAL